MSDQKIQPIDLAEQFDVIDNESAIAARRLPQLAAKNKMHWGAANRRIGGYKAAARTLKVLSEWKRRGKLPPELLQEIEAPL